MTAGPTVGTICPMDATPVAARPLHGSSGPAWVLAASAATAAFGTVALEPRVDAVAVAVWLTVTAVVGALVARHVPTNPIGWLLLTVGVLVACQGLGSELAQHGPAPRLGAWMANWMAVPGLAVLGFVVLLFPTGSPPSRRWRSFVAVGVLGLVLAAVGLIIRPGPVPGVGIENPTGVPGAARISLVLTSVGELLGSVTVVGAIAALVVRFRRSRGHERAQLKWFIYGVALLVAGLAFAAVAVGPLNEPSFVAALIGLTAVPVVIGIAVLEHHLYEIDRVINRTLVYGVLSIVLVGLYAITVGAVAVLFDRALTIGASLVGTVAVIVALQPLRDRLQRAVDRLVFGHRRDPAGALTALVDRLSGAVDPIEVTGHLVSTVADALKLPYVGLELEGRTVVEEGERRGEVERLPIVWQGSTLGALIVEGPLDVSARTSLSALVAQAAPTLRAAALTTELQASRERIVLAREEERRRLRDDLHDGLGSHLAGLTMGLDALDTMLADEPESARAVVGTLRQRSHEAVDAVRAAVRGLRPPALDELGLGPALQERAKQLAADGGIRLRWGSDDLNRLPAATEVAAYHIVVEALTNVVRHADASEVAVRIARDVDELRITIADDGRGLERDGRSGIGLRSMRERARELAGDLVVRENDGGGTVIDATLPIRP